MLWNPQNDLDIAGKILLRAEEVLEKRGWCQHESEDDWHRVCITRALHIAADPRTPQEAEDLREARDRLQKFLHMLPADWNDFICGSKAQAMEACRRAARQK